MFRLANIPHDNESTKDLATFLSSIASKTIFDALESWAPSAEAVCAICELYFTMEEADELTGTSFFKGTGQYFYADGKPLSDKASGEEILYRKISRMKEKMSDPDKVYTFDVFEEYIFELLIECAMSENMAYMDSMSSRHPQMDESGFTIDDAIRWMTLSEEEQETADRLKSRFQYSEEEAERAARQVHRIYEMGLEEDEDDNMFFWDTRMGPQSERKENNRKEPHREAAEQILCFGSRG